MNSIMKQKMVISNVRIPATDWLSAKVVAHELGMSMNQFMYSAMQTETKRLSLGVRKTVPRQKKLKGYAALDAFLHRAWSQKGTRKGLGLSEEDKAIYET